MHNTTATSGVPTPVGRIRDAFFALHFDIHPRSDDTELYADVTPEMAEALLERVRPDYIYYDCKGHQGYAGFPTQVGWAAPGIQKEALAIFRAATRKVGAKLVIHYSGVGDNCAAEKRPDWARVTPEGEPDLKGVRFAPMSTFGPYVEELLIPQIKEAIDRYEIDGAWIDGDHWCVLVDYCPAALAAWKQETGEDDAPRDAAHPRWQDWLAFNRRQYLRYQQKYLDALHAYKPGFEITVNDMYGPGIPVPVESSIDWLTNEIWPAPSALDMARFRAGYIEPLMIYTMYGIMPRHVKGHGWKPVPQMQQEASVVIAQGNGLAVYGAQPTRRGWIDPALSEQLGQLADYCRARQGVSHKTEAIPQVAVLLSTRSFFEGNNNVCQGSVATTKNVVNPAQGAALACRRTGYSVDVFSEHHLDIVTKRYPCIVLPESPVLDDRVVQALKEYADGGGRLLVIGATTAGLFRDTLGVTFEGEPAEEKYRILCTESTEQAWIVEDGLWQKVTRNGAEAIGWRHRYFHAGTHRETAATLNGCGKGATAAIYGPLASHYADFWDPRLSDFVGAVMRRLFPDPMAALDGPPCVDMTLRRKDGRLLIHLINVIGSCAVKANTIVDYIPPVGPITVRVKLDDRPADVKLVPGESKMTRTWEDGVLTVTLDSLAIHEVVSIGDN